MKHHCHQKEELFSQPKIKAISDGDCKHIQRVYRTHDINKFGKYIDDTNINDFIQLLDAE